MALISEKSLSTQGFAHKELKIAMGILAELPESEIFIVPVFLNECKIFDETLCKLKPVRMHESYETGLKQILRVAGQLQIHS